jgi:phage host-nuclease inhibitor protein Gam
MDKKILAHLASLTKSEMNAKAHKMSDIVDDLEELADLIDDEDAHILERAIKTIRELRLKIENLESRLR